MSQSGRCVGGQGNWAIRLASAMTLVALLGGCGSLQSLAELLGFESGSDAESAPRTVATATPAGSDRSVTLVALAQDPLSDDTLSEKRGGFSIAGMEFKFGLSLFTNTSNGLSLSTMLNMNNNGQWVPALTQTQAVPQASGIQSTTIALNSTATHQTPANTTMTQNGPITFTQSVGSPDTTQIVNQIAGKNIQTLITNTVNNVNVNNQATLNVQVNGAPNTASMMATFANINKFADQMSRLSH